MSFSLVLSFQSVYLSIWAANFPMCTFCLCIHVSIFSLFTFIGPWRGRSVKHVRSLLIKSSFVSTLPLAVFLPISKVSGGLQADQSRRPTHPHLLSNQTIPVLMLSVSLSSSSFFFSPPFFFLPFLSLFVPAPPLVRLCVAHPASLAL